MRDSSSPAAVWIFSSVSRRRLNALRRSRSCESTCAETALFHSSSSLLAFSNTTRSFEISMRRNCSMNFGCARRSASVSPRYCM